MDPDRWAKEVQVHKKLADENAQAIIDDERRKLRLTYLIRTILGVLWDAQTWPRAKAALGWSLAERSRITRAGLFN